MSLKISKAQKEVWDWKDAVYEDIKNLSSKERIEFFNKRSEKVIDSLGLLKVKINEGVYRLQKKKILTVGEEKEKYG